MKLTLLIFFLSFPIMSIGQDSKHIQNKFSVGFSFSPNYSYRMLSYSDDLQYIVEAREEFEQPSFGFNTGTSLNYPITKRLELEIGIQFSRQTQLWRDVPIVDISGSTNQGLGDSELRYQYLEIPIRINWLVVNKKLFGFLFGGASTNLFLYDQSKSWLTYHNGSTEVITGKIPYFESKKIGIALLSGIGVGYHFSEKLDFRIEPIIRSSLTSVGYGLIQQYNYSFGVQFVLKARL